MQLSVAATVASRFVGVLCIYYCRIEKGAGTSTWWNTRRDMPEKAPR